jgi:hypothetical protein
MAFGVPVKVTVPVVPEQIVVVVDAIAAIGNGNTVMVTLPVAGWMQLGVPEVATLTKLIVVLAV